MALIHTGGITRVLELLNADLGQIAVGVGTTPSLGASQLNFEVLRKPTTTNVIDASTLIKEIFIEPTEANVTISEIGILGDGATTTSGTGSLFASGGAFIIKDSTQSLTVSFEIEVKEVI